MTPTASVDRSQGSAARINFFAADSATSDVLPKPPDKKARKSLGTNEVRPHQVVDGRCVWHWKDDETIAEGWIVIDAPVPTAAGGGLFLHEHASLAEVRDVACAMSTKLAVSSQPQIVGAKGGIRFSHRAPQAPHVLERFVRDNAGVLSTYWGTGGDLNTSHNLIDEYAKIHCTPGTETALDTLSRALNCPTSAKDIPLLLKESVPVSHGAVGIEWPLEEYSVGYVMATTLKQMLLRKNPSLLGHARLVLQGFGNVGATFAQAAQDLGLGRIIGISSQYGFLVDQDGIDVACINKRRQSDVGASVGASKMDPKSLEAGLSAQDLQKRTYTPRRRASTDEEHLSTFLAAVKGDVFVPCAQRYILTPAALVVLAKETFSDTPQDARYVVAGANNIFAASEPRQRCLEKLDEASISMLPEWVSNSGTANLFMRTCSGLAIKGHALSNLAACAQDTDAFLHAVFARAGQDLSSTSLWRACDNVAAARREHGAVNLLGVKRISHLALISPDAKRSCETFQRVGNATAVADGNLFRLPGADDPTLSITQAPEGHGPADTGIHVRFSVYNLDKTRRVLTKEGIVFEERKLADQDSVELQLCGEKTGYPMSFCQARDEELQQSCLPVAASALPCLVDQVKQLDHYTLIVPDASSVKAFHERMMGYSHLRTITLNAGSAPEGEEDMLNHVMGLPFDSQRVLVITEGLLPESIFSKLLQRKRRPYVHHIALEVKDVEAAFSGVRAAGWGTTSDKISSDMLSSLRQFFLKEEEAGCFLELIERSDGASQVAKEVSADVAHPQDQDDEKPTYADESSNAKGQGEYRIGNMASLAQSMVSYVRD